MATYNSTLPVQVSLPVQSVFLHPTAFALAKLLTGGLASMGQEPADQPPESMDNGIPPKVNLSNSAVLACASPVLFLLHHLWSFRGLAALVSIMFTSSEAGLTLAADIVGWPGILPLLLLLLFLRELLTATASAIVLTCVKWLIVGRLRPSHLPAGSESLAFVRWRVGRLIQKELQPTLSSFEERSSTIACSRRSALASSGEQ